MRNDAYRVPFAGGDQHQVDAANDDPIKACIRFVDGVPTKADIAWVGRAFDAMLSNQGAMPLERCLRLPSTTTAWRKQSRDEWLCKAAAWLRVDRSWGAAQQLEKEWNRFICGYWQQWRDEEHPPELASDLNKALFYATRLNHSEGLNAKQISRIIGHSFRSKSP